LVYNVAVRPESQLSQIKEMLSDLAGLQIKSVGTSAYLQ
jgi:hypothetical protein